MPGINGESNTASKRDILPVVERFIESLRLPDFWGSSNGAFILFLPSNV
jgi:hypothetical protein